MKQISKSALAAALLLLGAAGHGQAAQTIQVTVNGTPIEFSGTPPTEIKGAVLVPLRGVFQALGASVDYNAATRVINAQKGATTVLLPLGSLQATVNGQPQDLSQPAQAVGGTTLVPLRFVAQALGAYVDWHAATSTVEITTQEPHLATLPAPPGQGAVTGQATGIYTDTNPQQITVRVNGKNTSVPISDSTIVVRSVAGQPGIVTPLAQIQPGDQVTIQRGADGAALSVTATFGEVAGTVKSIGRLASGNSVVTLNDGTTVELMKGAPVTMNGNPIKLSNVMTDEKVTIRTNPSNNLGLGVAVATGGDPNPVPPGQTIGAETQPGNSAAGGGTELVSTTSFSHNAARPLKAGDTLTATLVGTPRGKASFAIPGVAENVPMKETSPGVYTGSYTIPKNKSVSRAAVLGRLAANGATAPLLQASGLLTVDSIPPRITDWQPETGANVESERPSINAVFGDQGSGIDPAATQIRLDGADVTSQATITPRFFNLNPADPLAAGTHSVRVSVADLAGNTAAADWSFKITPGKLIQSFTTNADPGQALSAGTSLTFELTAQPGGKASVSLGDLAKSIPLRETSPGVYSGEYQVKRGDNLQNAPATARFVGKDGTTVTASTANGVTIAAGAPAPPKITSPENNGSVNADAPLSVSGTAAPGATVRVSVEYVSKALGGILPVSGSVGSKDAVADKDGKWTAEGLSLQAKVLFGRDTTYTVSAVTLDAAGETSKATTIKLRPQ